MKKKKYWWPMVSLCFCIVVGLSVKLLAISFNEGQQLKDYNISTLKGLKGITPIVYLDLHGVSDINTANWNSELQEMVEMTLYISRIKMIDKEVFNRDCPFLFVFIEVYAAPILKKAPRYVYAAKVSTGVHEMVQLVRNPKIVTKVQTWPYRAPLVPERWIHICYREELKKKVGDEIIYQLGVFKNDYFAANPKEPNGTKTKQKNKSTGNR